jgi:hypothetical protein
MPVSGAIFSIFDPFPLKNDLIPSSLNKDLAV